jgi:hypothetical protein
MLRCVPYFVNDGRASPTKGGKGPKGLEADTQGLNFRFFSPGDAFVGSWCTINLRGVAGPIRELNELPSYPKALWWEETKTGPSGHFP